MGTKRAREEDNTTFAQSSSPADTSDNNEDVGTAHTPKYATLDLYSQEQQAGPTMRCALPPHAPLSFPTYDAYETHYAAAHTNRCLTCHANFPTPHYLDLHIAESHDPIVEAKKAQGEKVYRCFVEGCEKVCGNWEKRRAHAVAKHGFPRNYDFLVVVHGVQGRGSLLRRGVDEDGHRRSSRERGDGEKDRAESEAETEEALANGEVKEGEDVALDQDAELEDATKGGEPVEKDHETKKTSELDEVTSAMSSLKMVPRSVTFGRRKARGGLAKS